MTNTTIPNFEYIDPTDPFMAPSVECAQCGDLVPAAFAVGVTIRHRDEPDDGFMVCTDCAQAGQP